MSIETMATSFPSRGPIQLDNMVVYKGPPASRKKSQPVATTLVEDAALGPTAPLEAGWLTSAGRSDLRAGSDKCIVAESGFSPMDQHAHQDRLEEVMVTGRTSRSGCHQMSLEWPEPLEAFNLGGVMYHGQSSPKSDVQNISASPMLDLGITTDVLVVDVDAHSDLSQYRLSDSVEVDTFQQSAVRPDPQPRAPTEEFVVDAGPEATSSLPSVSDCRVLAVTDFASNDHMNLSDDIIPAASESADDPVLLPTLVTPTVAESLAASREELRPAGTVIEMGLQESQEGLSDDTHACQDVDLTDIQPPAVEAEESPSAGQVDVDEKSHDQDFQQNKLELGVSEPEPSNSVLPAYSATNEDEDEDAPFVPGRRRHGPLSVRSPSYRPDDPDFRAHPARSFERPYNSSGGSLRGHGSKNGRKRMHVGCGHPDDHDITSKEFEILREAKDGSPRHRKARKRCSNDDCRSTRPGRRAVATCSPMTTPALSQPSRRRHGRDLDSSSPLSESCVESTSPGLQEQEQPTWAVDRIVKSCRKNGKLLYRVRWKDTWEPATSLRGCADTAVAEFNAGRPTSHKG